MFDDPFSNQPSTPVSTPASQPSLTSQTPADSSTQSSQSVSQSQPAPQNFVQPPSDTGKTKPFLKANLLIIALILIVLAAIVGLVIYFSFIKKTASVDLPSETVLPRAILVIEGPSDQQATTSAQIKISGKTNPNSQVMVYSETNEEIFESDELGNFSGVLTLDEGPNEITFSASGDRTEEVTETRSVVYVTDEEL